MIVDVSGNKFTIDDEDGCLFLSLRNPFKHPAGHLMGTINGKLAYFHRLLMKAGPGQIVDHINADPSDNRRCNLRLCTKSENIMNGGLRADNTSGYRGVSRNKASGKYEAYVDANGKRTKLGLFDTAIQAAVARDHYASRLHGLFFRATVIDPDAPTFKPAVRRKALGYSFNKEKRKYEAYVDRAGKRSRLGYFLTAAAAAEAVSAANRGDTH